jgi:hypothetical protein
MQAGSASANALAATAAGGEQPHLHHILVTGQSLALGQNGMPPLTTNQPYGNLMLSQPFQDGTHFLPLVEGGDPVETINSALGNTLTALSPETNYTSIVTRNASGALSYIFLRKGTPWYELGMIQIRNARAAALALGKSYQVAAVVTVHGESDHGFNWGRYYGGYLREWQRDYNADAKSITGQANDVPMFLSQMSSYTAVGSPTSLIPSAQLYAAENFPNLFLVGPKYFLTYSDGVHLTAESYRRLGEYYGKALAKVLVQGERWRPLTPDTIVLTGTNITVKLHVPAPPILIDTNAVLANANYGFEYVDELASASIAGVTITGPETLVIALDKSPAGSHPRLRYAITGSRFAWAGANQPGSARGNIRDSDATPSLYGSDLANWLVQFDYNIPFAAAAPLRIDSISSGQNQCVLGWPTVVGEDYVLEGATNLSPPLTWRPLDAVSGADVPPGDLKTIYTTHLFTNTIGVGSSFFRVRGE